MLPLVHTKHILPVGWPFPMTLNSNICKCLLFQSVRLSNQSLSDSLERKDQTLDRTYFEKLEQRWKEPLTSLTWKTR